MIKGRRDKIRKSEEYFDNLRELEKIVSNIEQEINRQREDYRETLDEYDRYRNNKEYVIAAETVEKINSTMREVLDKLKSSKLGE